MRIFSSIQAKVVSVIVVVLGVAVAISIYITVTGQRDSFLQETNRNLSVTSAILNNVVRNTMLVGEAPITIRTVNDLQTIGEFEDISIYRREGAIAFSDNSTIDAVNAQLGRIGFQPTDRLPLRSLDTPAFREARETHTPVYLESMEAQTVEYYFPILNVSECRMCHGSGDFVRGIAHIQVSTARVFDEINSTRDTLTFFFVVAGIALALVLLFLMRQIVLRPLLTIGSTVARVGQGDLETSVTVRSRDELGTLAGAINGMIEGLKERNRLEVENRLIDARNQENRKYLDNINEGLVLLDRDQVISEQYSHFLEELFGTADVSGRKFSQFIFPSDPPDSDRRAEIDQFIDLIFTSVTTEMEMIASINPLSNKVLEVGSGDDRQEIVVDATFQRIFSGEAVQNVMVIFVDRTELVRAERALANERMRSETEIEQIAAVLRSGPESFLEFAEDAGKTLQRLDQEAALSGGAKQLDGLFRDVHSLKGAARYMELRSFASTLNEVEEVIGAVRDGRRTPGRGIEREMHSLLERLYQGVDSIRRINERFTEFASRSEGAATTSVRTFFDNLQRMVADLSGEVEKSIRLQTATDADTLPQLREIRGAVIQLIRNAIDHGIEPEIERVAKGKDGTGTIRVTVAGEEDGSCRVEVQDDGQGIDLEGIARRARELGLITEGAPSRNQLIRVLFHPGFSSRDSANELSGRGVGLDAVQAAVHAAGGSIAIGTRADVGTRFTLRLPAQGGSR